MKFEAVKDFCRQKGIVLPLSWYSHYNCIRFHNENETKNHFQFKANVGFELMRRGATIFSEFEFQKRFFHGVKKGLRFPVCDLLWLDELMVIEFESNYTEEKARFKSIQFKPFNCLVFDIEKQSLKEVLERIGIND